MQLAANLSLLYADLPVAERFAAASQDGFRQVEILSPYDQPPDWYAQQLARHGLELVLINTPVVSPDHIMGLAAQPAAQALFRQAMQQAADVCLATGCQSVHVMAGLRDARYARDEQSRVLHENLRWAADTWPGLVLHLEALNRSDVADYFYSIPAQVAQELAAIAHPRVGMQFDFYHVVKEGLSPSTELERHFPLVRHVQIAGAPDRHEPDLGQDGLLDAVLRLDALGYTGTLGLEYRPATTARDGLDWLRPLLDENVIVCHNATS
ncbi:MAG TPA: TIM barrel protein [Burkholderiaceae bacterium]|nr:TIM barrel protein [Burkholderiaceae bacterium]